VRSAAEGEVSYQPEEHAAYIHEQDYRLISSTPYLWSSFIWNMFDFGSAHRNEGDVLGVNPKGLVTFDRQTRKDPFYFYKANWSAEPVTYIVGRRYMDRAYPVADVKVYSNAASVQLSVNGAPVGALSAAQCEQRTCIFRRVRASPGPNTLVATGNHGGNPLSDIKAVLSGRGDELIDLARTNLFR
jgi:beta-galactosidase